MYIDKLDMSSTIIPSNMRIANQSAFDAIFKHMNGQLSVIIKLKSEITSMYDRFMTMVNLLRAGGDEITQGQKSLYDTQITAFLHTMVMYLEARDSTNSYYINPVTEDSTSTTVSVSIQVPSGEITDEILVMYNVSANVVLHLLSIGTNTYTALTSDVLEETYGELPEEGPIIFLRDHFITGVSAEMVKLTKFCMDICKNETRIRSGMKYISELRGLGL